MQVLGLGNKEEVLVGAFKKIDESKFVEVFKSLEDPIIPRDILYDRIDVKRGGVVYEKNYQYKQEDEADKWDVYMIKEANPFSPRLKMVKNCLKTVYKEMYILFFKTVSEFFEEMSLNEWNSYIKLKMSEFLPE